MLTEGNLYSSIQMCQKSLMSYGDLCNQIRQLQSSMSSMSSMESMESVISYSFYGYKSGFADAGRPDMAWAPPYEISRVVCSQNHLLSLIYEPGGRLESEYN